MAALEINSVNSIINDPNLKAYYRFESGALTTDSSGESHTLTNIGLPTEDASGKFGGAAIFSAEGVDITLGTVSTDASFATYYWRAQPFTPTKNYITSVEMQLKKVGSPTGNITVEIQTDNAGAPSGTVLATTTINVATLTTSYAAYKVDVPTTLTASVKHHVCLKGQSAWDGSNDLNWAGDATGSTKGLYGAGDFSGTSSQEYTLKTYYKAAYSATDHADFKPTGSFTIGTWIKTSSTTGDKIIFQSYSLNPTNLAGIFLRVNDEDTVRFLIGRNTGSVTNTDYKVYDSTTTVTNGVWRFIVATWDGITMRLFIDGTEEGSGVAWANAPGYAATNYVRVGCGNNSGTNINFFTGSLDDVFFINGAALSADQIASIYDGTINSASPSASPSISPSTSPSTSPSISLSASPSTSPSISPSASPSLSLSSSPSTSPSISPSASPSLSQSISPSPSPSTSISPSASPSISDSASPSTSPSVSPSESPSPSLSPSISLSSSPSTSPSISPSTSISTSPSISPSASPSPSISPSLSPSISQSLSPSASPSLSQSVSPSISISISPSASPSISISVSPSPSRMTLKPNARIIEVKPIVNISSVKPRVNIQ